MRLVHADCCHDAVADLAIRHAGPDLGDDARRIDTENVGQGWRVRVLPGAHHKIERAVD